MEILTPKTCTRCQGRGFLEVRRTHLGVPGTCFKCNGVTVVEGNKTRLAEYKLAEAHAAELAEMARSFRQACFEYDRAERAAQRMGWRDADTATASMILELQQPKRFYRAARSYAAGRQDVFPALLTWLLTEAQPTH